MTYWGVSGRWRPVGYCLVAYCILGWKGSMHQAEGQPPSLPSGLPNQAEVDLLGHQLVSCESLSLQLSQSRPSTGQ